MSDDILGSAWQEEDGLHVDTRGLQPPDPMVAVLKHLEQSPACVTVHMDREPVHLFPELQERNWIWEVIHIASGDVRLILRPAQ